MTFSLKNAVSSPVLIFFVDF